VTLLFEDTSDHTAPLNILLGSISTSDHTAPFNILLDSLFTSVTAHASDSSFRKCLAWIVLKESRYNGSFRKVSMNGELTNARM
jgi:hypothetical protein